MISIQISASFGLSLFAPKDGTIPSKRKFLSKQKKDWHQKVIKINEFKYHHTPMVYIVWYTIWCFGDIGTFWTETFRKQVVYLTEIYVEYFHRPGTRVFKNDYCRLDGRIEIVEYSFGQFHISNLIFFRFHSSSDLDKLISVPFSKYHCSIHGSDYIFSKPFHTHT